MASMTLTDLEIQSFPEPVRKFLLERFQPASRLSTAEQETAQPVLAEAVPDGGPADVTPQQAKSLLKDLHGKTGDLIRHLVNAPEDGFYVPEIAAQMGVAPGKLGGSWSGITKVTRRLLGADAGWIEWKQRGDGSWHGRMSPVTRDSFRKVLNID